MTDGNDNDSDELSQDRMRNIPNSSSLCTVNWNASVSLNIRSTQVNWCAGRLHNQISVQLHCVSRSAVETKFSATLKCLLILTVTFAILSFEVSRSMGGWVVPSFLSCWALAPLLYPRVRAHLTLVIHHLQRCSKGCLTSVWVC